MTASWLWAVFTVIAAFTQTVRNAMQRELTATLGTVGATHVRFLFGFPFAISFLASLLHRHRRSRCRAAAHFWPWVLAGAFAQVAATALMLTAMGGRSFVVTIAYIKTEPILVAIFGRLPRRRRHAGRGRRDLIATSGVVIMSTNPLAFLPGKRGSGERGPSGAKPTLLGLASGRHVCAVGGRLPRRHPQPRHGELYRAVVGEASRSRSGIAMQAVLLFALSRAPPARGVVCHHARMEVAYCLPAWPAPFASQFLWFLAFALSSAANVRTLCFDRRCCSRR